MQPFGRISTQSAKFFAALDAKEQATNALAWTTVAASPSTVWSWSASPAASVRGGAYRLARLAAKFGPGISLRDLTERFSYDCMWRA
jgi:hypothetical protein